MSPQTLSKLFSKIGPFFDKLLVDYDSHSTHFIGSDSKPRVDSKFSSQVHDHGPNYIIHNIGKIQQFTSFDRLKIGRISTPGELMGELRRHNVAEQNFIRRYFDGLYVNWSMTVLDIDLSSRSLQVVAIDSDNLDLPHTYIKFQCSQRQCRDLQLEEGVKLRIAGIIEEIEPNKSIKISNIERL